MDNFLRTRIFLYSFLVVVIFKFICLHLLYLFDQGLALRLSFLEYLQDVFTSFDALELVQFNFALVFSIALLPDDVGINVVQCQTCRKRCILIKFHTQRILKGIRVGCKRPRSPLAFSQLEHAASLCFFRQVSRLLKALPEHGSLFALGSSDDARLAHDLRHVIARGACSAP